MSFNKIIGIMGIQPYHECKKATIMKIKLAVKLTVGPPKNGSLYKVQNHGRYGCVLLDITIEFGFYSDL
jgi:hypothetical protein